MNDIMAQLQTPLLAHEIDFRVQSVVNRQVNGKWQVCANMLAYKDARCDMKRLDDVFGYDGWQRLHKEHKGMLFGGVAIKDVDGKWIEKWDVGEASSAHADKGLASDSFKRACFNLGIGRELYDYPEILVPLYFDGDNSFISEYFIDEQQGKKKYKAGFALRPKEWVWFSQFSEGELSYLACKHNINGESRLRFQWGEFEKPKKEAA